MRRAVLLSEECSTEMCTGCEALHCICFTRPPPDPVQFPDDAVLKRHPLNILKGHPQEGVPHLCLSLSLPTSPSSLPSCSLASPSPSPTPAVPPPSAFLPIIALALLESQHLPVFPLLTQLLEPLSHSLCTNVSISHGQFLENERFETFKLGRLVGFLCQPSSTAPSH